MRAVLFLISLAFALPAAAAEKPSVKVPPPQPAEAKKATKPVAAKPKRKGKRFDLKRSREPRGYRFRDWDSGLQFVVSGGKLSALSPQKDPQGLQYEAQVSVGNIAVRTHLATINAGEGQSEAELVQYLDDLTSAYRDPDIEPRQVVVLESDLRDGMGLVEAGASVDVVLPAKGKHCCEQSWVLVQGDKRVTINIRYNSGDLRSGRWVKFQNKFIEALKLANTDNWK